MTLPDCLKEIEDLLKEMEDLAKEMTLELLKTDSGLTFIINLIVIAAAPAIGEELMFRGALQRTLHENFSPFWAITLIRVLYANYLVVCLYSLVFVNYFIKKKVGGTKIPTGNGSAYRLISF